MDQRQEARRLKRLELKAQMEEFEKQFKHDLVQPYASAAHDASNDIDDMFIQLHGIETFEARRAARAVKRAELKAQLEAYERETSSK